MKRDQNNFNDLTIFEKQVLDLVKKIPRGKVTTYKFLARAAGRAKASRAIGNALKKNPDLIEVPCHRVVRSNGKIGDYRLGQKKKWLLLKKEGIESRTKDQIKNFNKVLHKF